MILTLRQIFNTYFSSKRKFVKEVKHVSGFTPKEIFLYDLAVTHSSFMRGNKEQVSASAKLCNERLEYLGDSVLDTVIAEYLFKLYPTSDEGFLTEMRSKIVNRKSLNRICHKINLGSLIKHNQSGSINNSMYGDAIEAFIGAVYLDLGYTKTRRFIYNKIISPHLEISEIESQIISFKNKLIEYTQKNKMGILEFDVLKEYGEGFGKRFRIQAKVEGQKLGIGEGKNKKNAEQRASLDSLIKLGVFSKGEHTIQ